jgi:hypothetical protein
MAAKLTRLTHKIAIQLHLVTESCTICSSHSRRPVRKLLDTFSYVSPYEEQSYLQSSIWFIVVGTGVSPAAWWPLISIWCQTGPLLPHKSSWRGAWLSTGTTLPLPHIGQLLRGNFELTHLPLILKLITSCKYTSWDSSVSIVTRLPARRPVLEPQQGHLSFILRYHVQAGFGTHLASFSNGYRGRGALFRGKEPVA